MAEHLLPGLVAKIADAKVVVRKAASQALVAYMHSTRDKETVMRCLLCRRDVALPWPANGVAAAPRRPPEEARAAALARAPRGEASQPQPSMEPALPLTLAAALRRRAPHGRSSRTQALGPREHGVAVEAGDGALPLAAHHAARRRRLAAAARPAERVRLAAH